MSGDRRRVHSGSPLQEAVGYCRAVRIGDRIIVSGTAPVWPDGSCPDSAVEQARRCFDIALRAVEELGGAPRDAVRTRMYLVDAADGPQVGAVHRELFSDSPPASTMLVVAALLDPRWKVEIELEVVVSERRGRDL